MAKIRDSKPKQSSGGYERLVGNTELADIFTKAQSTVISNGTELEKIISGMACTVIDLDTFIDDCDKGVISDGRYLCTKKQVKTSAYRLKGHEPAPKIPFRTKYYICCFNQMDKNKIVTGFKGVFTTDEVMTGKEFCDILEIDYNAIMDLRKTDTADNFRYVVEKMTEIKAIKDRISEKNRQHILENEFYAVDNEGVSTPFT